MSFVMDVVHQITGLVVLGDQWPCPLLLVVLFGEKHPKWLTGFMFPNVDVSFILHWSFAFVALLLFFLILWAFLFLPFSFFLCQCTWSFSDFIGIAVLFLFSFVLQVNQYVFEFYVRFGCFFCCFSSWIFFISSVIPRMYRRL